MVNSCSAYGCTRRYKKGQSFFRFPKDAIRREQWRKAVKREDWKPTDTSCLCEKHFQTGRPSKDENHPDYIPNVFIFNKSQSRSAECYKKRKSNQEKYNNNRLISNANVTNSGRTDRNETNSGPTVADEANSELTNGDETNFGTMDAALSLLKLSQSVPPAPCCNSCLCKDAEIEYMRKEKEELLKKIEILETEIEILKEEADETKVKLEKKDEIGLILTKKQRLVFYTGLHHKNVFDWLLSKSLLNINTSVQVVTPERQLLIVLIKFRLNLDQVDLAYRFRTSRSTVKRIFDIWIPYLAKMLRSLIKWPDLCLMQQNLPQSFQTSLYKDTVCIIDCTEVPIERPGNQKARSITWSSYKHNYTIKFLIGVSPTGKITFLSNCYGGKASDKFITLRSHFLDLIKPGDVLADRGFILEDYFTALGAYLITPSFVRNKKQLSKLNVVRSKMISNVRILVERVIGHVKKFEILNGKIPIRFLKYTNDVITVCAALHNLCSPIIK